MGSFINIDNSNSNYILTGDIDRLIDNKRAVISLKRLKFINNHNREILVPYDDSENEIIVLQELYEILKKFNFSFEISRKIKEKVSSFDREEKYFQEFSSKARKIRNDSFKEEYSLVEGFNSFKNVLSSKLIRKLYPMQLLSSYHMAFAQNSCNFSVPGAGKTSIVYGAYLYLKELPNDDERHIDKILIIGPLSSFISWESEYEECFGIRPKVKRLSGACNVSRIAKQQHLYSSNPAEITLISHGGVDSFKKEIIDFLRNNKVMVVIDEAHRIKNPNGVWGRAIVEIAKEAKARIVLTGTPVPNGYEDLFNIYKYLYPYKYDTILKFHYDNLKEMTRTETYDSDRVKNFIDNISPYFIRIKKKDLNLPPIKENTIYVEMDDCQKEIYNFIESKYIKSFKESNNNIKDILNRAKLIRLRQAAINPALLKKPIKDTLNLENFESEYFNDSIIEEFQEDSLIVSKINSYSKKNIPNKFIKVKDILLDKITINGNKAIIWTIFVQNAKELNEYLQKNGVRSKLLIGEVNTTEREKVIKKFNNPDNSDFQIVIANPFAVAESISLHKGCHNAIYIERDYNCASFMQSKDRIHRVGLRENQETSYYYILSSNSIDCVIDKKLNEKIERMEKIIDDDIPLFCRIKDNNENEIIKALLEDYAKRI